MAEADTKDNIGTLVVIDDEGHIPFITVGGDRMLTSVPGKYQELAQQIIGEVTHLDGLLLKKGSFTKENPSTGVVLNLGRFVKPGEDEYPEAVAAHCQYHDVAVRYQSNEQ